MEYIKYKLNANESVIDDINGLFFYSERLKVRSIRIADLADFYFYRSNPEVAKYISYEKYNAEEANEFIVEQVEKLVLQQGE